MFSADDFAFMQRALELAERGMYTTTPNPRVGCVLVKDGQIIGEGWTQPAGSDHAEVHALKDARSRGLSPQGASAYVTLEPCSHFGRTPPCARALVEAGVSRVIAAMEDPNPRVSGSGLALLRQAGVDVRCGLLEKPARELNIGFVSRMTRGRPWVRLKMAASLDGFTALPSGESQWITGAAARADGHAWRARACAILTGAGTVRQDDPQLTVREVDTPRQPLRIVVDSHLRLPLSARLLEGDAALIVCATEAGDAAPRAAALRERGAEVIALPHHPDVLQAKVDLPGLMQTLGSRGINELHVEAGTKLSGALIESGCVDEWLIYIAPSLLGKGFGLFEMAAPADLASRPQLAFHAVDRMGDDLRVLARWKAQESSPDPLKRDAADLAPGPAVT